MFKTAKQITVDITRQICYTMVSGMAGAYAFIVLMSFSTYAWFNDSPVRYWLLVDKVNASIAIHWPLLVGLCFIWCLFWALTDQVVEYIIYKND